MRKIVQVALLALTCLASTTAFAQEDAKWKGKPMTAFSMTDLDGKKYTNKSFKGKVVVMDFWATWCGPCKMLIPHLSKLHSKYNGQGVVVIGADGMERPGTTADQLKAFAKQNGLTYKVTMKNDELAQKLQVQGIPTVVVIDKRGVIQYYSVGFSDQEPAHLEALVKKLLAK